MSLISAAMLSVVGRPFNEAESYPVSRSDIRRWAIAVYYPQLPPPLYYDEDYARTTGFGGIVAPEDFNPFAWASVQPGMTARQAEPANSQIETILGIEGPNLKTRINGGSTVEYGVRMRPGDVIHASSALLNYSERTGRLGPMLINVVRTTWTNQAGELVKATDQTSIRY